jgi:hypothetical protein
VFCRFLSSAKYGGTISSFAYFVDGRNLFSHFIGAADVSLLIVPVKQIRWHLSPAFYY